MSHEVRPNLRRWRPTRPIPAHIARLRALRSLRMGAERFDRLLDGRLLPLPGRNGYDLSEIERRARFISHGSAAGWSRWCWSACKPANEVRRLVAAETPDVARLAALLDRMEDVWRLGLAARPPEDVAHIYRTTLNMVRLADTIASARAALGMEALPDVQIDERWLAAAAG